MSDPYKVLGVAPTATDSEIKTAYRELVRKYHPDRHEGNPLAEVAAEKMAQINEAYDQIMNERRSGGYGYGSYDTGYGQTGGAPFDSNYVRQLLTAGSITQAEQILNSVPSQSRGAEWYFLMGSVCYKRGWLNDAYSNFTRAYQLEPGNREYGDAVSRMNAQRSGYMNNGSNANPYSNGGGTSRSFGGSSMFNNPISGGNVDTDQACDCCSKLICADCLCECMGGDLIPCC